MDPADDRGGDVPLYEYTALKDPTCEIRLLHLQWDENEDGPLLCKVKTFGLRETPDYFALSYVWGSGSPTQDLFVLPTEAQPDEPTVTGRQVLKIGMNLADALRRLRKRTSFDWKSKPFLVWADAVCINQSSVEERNQQVRIMHRIYRFATSVWVYPIDSSAHHLKARSSSTDNLSMSHLHRSFFAEAYWSRAWVVQELYFARDIWIVYGDKEAPLDIKSWKPGTPLLAGLGFFGSPPRHLQSEMTQLKKIKYTELVDASTGPHLLYSLLWQCRNRRATLPQDKIYSLMNILPTSTPILQDYSKSPAAVYGEFLKLVISRGSKHTPCRPLDFLSPTHNITTTRTPGLPSWCPDFCEYPDTVDILDNVPATHSSSVGSFHHTGRHKKHVRPRAESYQPWLEMRGRWKPDAQDSEPSLQEGGVLITEWDLPYTPLLCISAMLDEDEPPHELTIRGIRLDTVKVLSDNVPLHPEKFTLNVGLDEVVNKWKGMVSGVYRPTLESASLAFMKTLLINSHLSETDQATAASALKHALLAPRPDISDEAVNHTDGIENEQGHGNASSYHHGTGKEKGKEKEEGREVQTPLAEYIHELQTCLPGWRFATTSKSYYAKVPNRAREGDIIVIGLGSSTPFLLREKRGEGDGDGRVKYELIGRCFVHGWMNGKGMEKVDRICGEWLAGRGKADLGEGEWGELRGVVEKELEGFTLV